MLGIVLHLRIFSFSAAELAAGVLPDSDSYTHLLRAEALRAGRAAELDRMPQFDAPGGLSQHWTLPFTLMLVLPAGLAEMAAGIGTRQAIFWWGVAICPLLHILAALAAIRAARAVWPPRAETLAGMLVLLNPAVMSYSAAGRADHHTLLLLCAVVALGAGLRGLTLPDPARAARHALLAGAAAGFGVWVNPEGLLTLVPLLAAAAMAWWLAGDQPRRFAGLGARISLGALAVTALALLIERPAAARLAVEYDRVSVAHAALMLAAFLVFALAWAATPRLAGGGARLGLGAMAAVAAALPLWLAFPGLFGVSGGFDAGSAVHFVPFVAEMRPVLLWGKGALRDVLVYLGGGLAGLLALALVWRQWRDSGLWPAGVLLAVALVLGLAATAAHLRAGVDLAAPAAIAAAGLAGALQPLAAGRPAVLRLAAGLVAAGLMLAPVLAPLIPDPAQTAAADQCDGAAMARWLAAARPGMVADAPAPVVVTNLFVLTPQLAYHTGYRFVASPYHRGGTAFEDTARIVLATDDAAARALLAKRDARLLLLCRTASHVRIAEPDGALLPRLRRGETPDWLEPVPLPRPLAEEWMLFALRDRSPRPD